MASASVTRSTHHENRFSNYFKKTVFLEDWWLVKAEKDVEGKRVAVAGFTCRDTHQARRLFSSAPILKIQDVFTLETTDGICVILEGFINKTRTQENGFTANVFDHFIFGFPPQWEEFAEKCMAEELTTNLFSRSPNSGKKFNGVEGCEDILTENEQHSSDCVETSVEIPKSCEVDFGSGVSTVDLQQTNENNEGVNASKILENFLDKTTSQPIANLATGSSPFEGNDIIASPSEASNINVSARKDESIRKCKTKFSSKTNRKVTLSEGDNEDLAVPINLEKENLNNKSSYLPEEILSNSNPFNTEVEDPMAEITAVNPNKKSVKLSSSKVNKKNGKNRWKKASITKEAITTKRSAKRVLNYESPIAQGGKDKAIEIPLEGTNVSNKDKKSITRTYQRKRKLKFNNAEEDQGFEILDNLNKKSSNLPDEISSHLSPLDPQLQQDRTDVINPDVEKIGVSPSGAKAKPKKDINCGKKSSISRKNTEKETPTRQKQKEFILSPESMSSKRSRSGRLLLPSLEFWRNQTVLYDADRHIAGIKQDPPADELSRGSKSERKRKRK